MRPAPKVSRPEEFYFAMQGKEVFGFAVQRGAEVISEVLREAGQCLDSVRALIPHQANKYIIRAIADTLGIAPERFIINLDRYGNTASASVLIALDEALECKKISSGDLAVLVAFGGGLSWAASLVQF